MKRKKNGAGPISVGMRARLNYVVPFVLLVFLSYILYNFISLATIRASEMREYASNQQMSTTTINANRGTIYDSQMKILAQSSTVWTVIISPANIPEEDKETVAKGLSEILEVDYNTVLEKTKKDNQYEIIKKKIAKPQADEVRKFIKDNGFYSITLQEDTLRTYPEKTLAAQVIGFTNADNQGTYGLEQQYNDILQGTPGKIMSATDGKGNIIPTSFEKKYEAIDGNSLVTTLDSTIQYYAEKALEEAVAIHKPKDGAVAIVMNVKTGAILAMANYPSFDLNEPYEIYSDLYKQKLENPTEKVKKEDGTYVEEPLTLSEEEKKKLQNTLMMSQWKNQAIADAYMPGSVFKIVTAAASLETGTHTLNSTFNCPGYITVAGRRINCHKHSGHGTLDFTGAIVNSCNPAFITMGMDLGADNFVGYLEDFGLGEKTGIDLVGEGLGVHYSADNMGPVELASSAFGQSTTVTPIQMITAIAAAVNGGNLVQPYIVQEVLDQDGNVIQKTEPTIKRQVISSEVSQQLNLALEKMVSSNGGTATYIKGYRIGGKSGTTEINNNGSKYGYVGSFAAFAPVDDPEVAAIVVMKNTSGSEYYGSKTAGPALGSIMADVLPYLGIMPEYSAEDLANMEKTVGNYIGGAVSSAKNDLASKGLEAEVIGSGETVLEQVPAQGVAVADGSKVILYTEKDVEKQMTTVPNVTGLSLSQANATLKNYGLNISLNGSFVEGEDGDILVTGQDIAQGESVPKGTVISVTYSRNIEY